MPPAYPFTLVRFTNNTALIQPPEADQRRERNFTPRRIWNFHTEEDAQNWRRIPACERQCEWGWWCQPQSHITTVLLCVCECNCVSVCVCVRVRAILTKTGWTAKINKHERVEQWGGKSPAHWGLTMYYIIVLFGLNSPAGPSRQVGLSWDRARPGCSSTGGSGNNQQMRGVKPGQTHRPLSCYFRLQQWLLAVHLWQTLTVSQKYVPSYFTAKQ